MASNSIPDYGHNGKDSSGLWVMHPSGDHVTTEEKDKRLRANAETRGIKPATNQILGMSWDELERKQGGKLKH